MHRGLVVLLVALLALGPAAGCLAGPAPSPVPLAAADTVAAQDFDQTVFEVTVFENGSARWTFVYRRGLANETERQQFEDFATRFNAEETQLFTDFRNRAEQLTVQGADTTGREMSATSFTKEARIGSLGNQGIVEMSFLWNGFAVTDGSQVVVGDVFEGGLYVGASQALVFSWGDRLAVDSVTPAADDSTPDSLTWSGERQFRDNRPRVVFTTGDSATTDSGTTDSGTTDGGSTTSPSTPEDEGLPMVLLGGLLVVALVAIGGAGAYRYGLFGTTTDDGSGPSSGGAAAEPAIPDEELVSDEDRVLSMLEENGGRMKQVNIVERTGWSKSKVSMLLSDMEEEGSISKLRVGRENIISMAGHEPEGARSPFDDDRE